MIEHEHAASWAWFKPHGDYHEWDTGELLHFVTVDGVRYVTDQILLLRADFLPPIVGIEIREQDAPSVAEVVRTVLTEHTEDRRGLHPMFAVELPEAGFTLECIGKNWQIFAAGELVGVVAGHTNYHHEPGAVPAKVSTVYSILDGMIDDRYAAWGLSAQIFEAVTR